MNPSDGQARSYLQQLCTDTGCSLADLLEAMDDKREFGKSVRKARHDYNDDYEKCSHAHKILLKPFWYVNSTEYEKKNQ